MKNTYVNTPGLFPFFEISILLVYDTEVVKGKDLRNSNE